MFLTNDIAAYRIAELHAQAAEARRARAARSASRATRRSAAAHGPRLTPRARLSARLFGQSEVWCRHAAGRAARSLV
jgi:uncharacterized protein with von Willebrand factor type A (vWA) domain